MEAWKEDKTFPPSTLEVRMYTTVRDSRGAGDARHTLYHWSCISASDLNPSRTKKGDFLSCGLPQNPKHVSAKKQSNKETTKCMNKRVAARLRW